MSGVAQESVVPPAAMGFAGRMFSRGGTSAQVVTLLVPLLLWALPLQVVPRVHIVIVILGFMLASWITDALDTAVTGLIGCFLFWATAVAKFDLAFSGFVDTTAWFMIAAAIIGLIADKTIATRKLSHAVLRVSGATYPRLLLGLILTNFLLTFIVPSGISRLVIMAAIATGLMESLRLEKGSNIGRGIFLTLTYTSALFDKFLISGATSITGRGLMERFGDVSVSWSGWMFAFLPLSIASVLICWFATIKLFPPEPVPEGRVRAFLDQEKAMMPAWGPTDVRAAILLGSAVILWITDFLHHLNPVMVGLGVALAALLPRIGVLDATDLRRANLMPFFFVASAISMGSVLLETGVLENLTGAMLDWMKPYLGSPLERTSVLYWSAFSYHFLLASEVSMMTTSLPSLMTFTQTHGLDPTTAGLVWVFASGGKLFAYQSAVTVAGYAYGYFSAKDLLKLGAVLTIVEFICLLPVALFYWPAIGL